MPIPLPMRLSRPLAVAALVLGVSAALAAASPAHAAADPLSRALARGEITEPEYALAQADALFHPRRFASRYPGAHRPGPHDATGVLRRLRAALPALRGRRARAGAGLLARPTEDSDPYGLAYSKGVRTVCTQHICVHWVIEGPDAPSLADTDHSGSADWAETTAAVFEEVWAKEVGSLGYRAPLADAASSENGGDGRLDATSPTSAPRATSAGARRTTPRRSRTAPSRPTASSTTTTATPTSTVSLHAPRSR